MAAHGQARDATVRIELWLSGTWRDNLVRTRVPGYRLIGYFNLFGIALTVPGIAPMWLIYKTIALLARIIPPLPYDEYPLHPR